MPIYEYECEACHCRFEVMQKFSDKPLKKCAKCGSGPLAKVLSPPALVFKGTGWYVTDYGRPDRERAKGKKADGDSKGNGSKASESTASTAAASSTKAD
ncbi:MAG: zinc ribbon domain-containing protein [candidate division NC10 bacterium]|nr:zinc ribbon domain-containing protein [candidate division NC10 bacterium]